MELIYGALNKLPIPRSAQIFSCGGFQDILRKSQLEVFREYSLPFPEIRDSEGLLLQTYSTAWKPGNQFQTHLRPALALFGDTPRNFVTVT